MYSLSEDKISKDIDKIIGKLHVLKKKKSLWGLTEEENKILMNLTFEYAKNYYQFIDNIFNNYIEPFIYNEKIIEIKCIFKDKYCWDGNLLCFDSKLKKIFKGLSSDDKETVILLLKEVMNEELKMVNEFESSEYGIETIELFSSLQNVDKEGCVGKYIKTRYNIMISMIEEV